jgi:hypothetical protein
MIFYLTSLQPRVQQKHSYTSTSPYHHPSYASLSSRNNGSHPRVHVGRDHHRDDLAHSTPRHYSPSTPRCTHPGLLSSYQTPLSRSLHQVDPLAVPSPGNPKAQLSDVKTSFDGTHSFDVLRSDPGTVSLEHIASSKTLQNRSSNAPKATSPTGVANGSAPAFRVALPALPSTTSVRTEIIQDATDKTLDQGYTAQGDVPSSLNRQPSTIPVNDPSESSAMVSFTLSDGSSMSKMTVDYGEGSYLHEGAGGMFRVDGRGKKHQCPQCPKRFNRPSSLRIHVNTHTGARRM